MSTRGAAAMIAAGGDADSREPRGGEAIYQERTRL
jgi:hypothetical protein